MKRLALTCKVLCDRDYFAKCKEVYDLKKNTARMMFYHGIDADLRDVNAYVVRCDCDKCLDAGGNNYPPSNPQETHQLLPGDVFFSTCAVNLFTGVLWEVVDEAEDAESVTRDGMPVRSVVRQGTRSSEDCLLMAWFRRECERHRLPRPAYNFGIRSLSLWTELGHRGTAKWVTHGESWRDIVRGMPYPVQVERIYHGLLHESLSDALISCGRPSSVRDTAGNSKFEDWFKVGDASLLP